MADNIYLQYQGTARQGEGRRAGEEKPKNPYAGLKAAKRERASTAVVGAISIHLLQPMAADICPKPPKKAAAKRVGRGIEGRQGGPKNETVVKKTTAMKETTTPLKKRKAVEDLEEVSAAVSDVAERAPSTIYKKRKVVAEAKAEAVFETKPVEREARVSSEKKRKAVDALDGDAAQPVVHGDDELSAKKRRTQDQPTVETEALEQEATALSKNVKTEVFVTLKGPSWSGSHVPIGFTFFKTRGPSSKSDYSEGPRERGPQLY